MRQAAFMLLFSVSGFSSQLLAQDATVLKALLTEVHQLRLDIEGMTLASQRVQIALYSLQMQDATVARATSRLQDAQNRCASLENERDHAGADVQKWETAGPGSLPPELATKENREAFLAQRKHEYDAKQADLQSCRTIEAQAASQFQSEQGKLGELQDRIARLDKALENMGRDGR